MHHKTTRIEGMLVPGGWEEFGKVSYVALLTDDDRKLRIDGRRGIGCELRPYLGKRAWVTGYRHSENTISVTGYGFDLRPRFTRDERRRSLERTA